VKSLRFLPKVEADLADIWRYSAEHWGLNQAERYIDDIRDACRALAVGRHQGRAVDVRPGYLKYLVGRHMLYFRECSDRLDIIRILHGAMDVNRHL